MPEDIARAYVIVRQFLMPYWKAILLVMLANIAIGAIVSLRPLLLAPALDVFAGTEVTAAESLNQINLSNVGPTLIALFGVDPENLMELGVLIAGLLFSASLVVAALTVVGQLFLLRTRACIVRDLAISLYRHLLTLSLAFFHQRKTGDIVSRITQDVKRTGRAMDKIVQNTLRSAIQVIVTFVILLKTDLAFTFVIIVIGSLHMVTNKLLGDRVKDKSYRVGQITGDVGAHMYESLSGIKTLKMFAAERYNAKNTTSKTQQLTDSTIQHAKLNFYQQPLRMMIDALMASFVLLLVFYAISTERMTLTAAALFFYLSQQVSKPLSELFSQGISIKSMLGAAERIFQVFNTENEIKDGSRDVEELADKVDLSNVTFSYPDGTVAVDGITCEIRKGDFVGLVGPSGSGKTTLVDLLMRLHDCTGGAIYFDGVNIKEFKQREYRRQFGIVAQDNFLFNATIRENIVFNRRYDSEALQYALWVSNALEFVESLEQGVETELGDRGVRLSGGQQQRIAIARAIYGVPSILILDEATSALDTDSERQVQKAINRVSKEITTVVIAHRLSTVRHADKIVVLNRGRIEATGSHEELMNTSATYNRLVRIQELGSSEAPSEYVDIAQT